jgi:hypothetical protein
MQVPDDSSILNLRGIVVPVEWGDSGEPLRVGLLTHDEGEYEVEPEGANRLLLNHLRREVLVRAVVTPSSGTVQRVHVLSFAVLEWNDTDNRETASPQGVR